MRLRAPSAMFGAFAATLLAAASVGNWSILRYDPPVANTEEKSLPAPPRLSADPDYGRCLDSLADDPQTALTFADAWASRGGDDGAKHCAALAMLAQGDVERAAVWLEGLAEQSSTAAEARAEIYGQAAQAWLSAAKPERAYGAVTLALSLVPTDSDLLLKRAVAAGAMGRFEEALMDATRATALRGERPTSWVIRAAALRHLDRTQEAMRDVDRALSIDPHNPEGLLERGILRQMSGDLNGARTDWEQTVDTAPGSTTADLAQQNLALSEAGPSHR